jgi:hypothetical protein
MEGSGECVKQSLPCATVGSHSHVAEDSNLLGCDAVSVGKWFPAFQRIASASTSTSSILRTAVLEDGGDRSFETSLTSHPTQR